MGREEQWEYERRRQARKEEKRKRTQWRNKHWSEKPLDEMERRMPRCSRLLHVGGGCSKKGQKGGGGEGFL